ncbi:hypothetical protein PPYR_08637 [Photinus pyralis]|uniref:UBC core domain-containing protein n=1 Tax=Photinus pyralis TaxID=7054 RepID=A0A1Y1KFX7_PHOPY|nr:protein crossbronx homolog [Photinus pyralis]KAB0797644.1 hypothetical protein PPYR_08637 [Photinus pyralis]
MIPATTRPAKVDPNTTNQSFTRQGSLRRVIPSEHNKDNIFGRQNEDINMFYKTVHQEYIILAEYKMVVSENIKSIYVIPSKENSFVWFGVIFVRSGLYEDGIFRFTISLPDSFPDGEHPKVVFQSEIFHPVIHADNNQLDLSSGFPTWTRGEQHIWQVIKYVHWIFYNVENSIEHAVNREAANLYTENLDTFKERVKECVKKSQEQLYTPPPTNDKHYITFEKYTPKVHDEVKVLMLDEANESRLPTVGHSWVSPGSFKPLSRAPTPGPDSIS